MNTYLVLVAASRFERPEPDYRHVERAESAQAATAQTCRWLVERRLIPDGAEPAEYLRDVRRAIRNTTYEVRARHMTEGRYVDLANAEAYATQLRTEFGDTVEIRGLL